MYSENCKIMNTMFQLSCESMNIYASHGSLKEMLKIGLMWLNTFSLHEFQKSFEIRERNALITCYAKNGSFESLNDKLQYPIEGLVLEIDLLTKRITFQFFMNG